MRNAVLRVAQLFLVIQLLSGCIHLKNVQDYTNTSITTLSQFEQLSYTFKKHCTDKCLMQSVGRNAIARDVDCNCDAYAKADSLTMTLYNSLRAYFSALGALANDEVTSYNFDPLNKALTENLASAGGKMVEVTPEQVSSYSKIASLLLKATTEGYRKKKLKDFVNEGNAPVKILLAGFQQILQNNLRGELNFKKERLYTFYNEIVLDESSSIYERRKATLEYYAQTDEVSNKKQQIEALVSSLKKVAEGHDALTKASVSPKELTGLITPISNDMKALIAEFNKLKKSE